MGKHIITSFNENVFEDIPEVEKTPLTYIDNVGMTTAMEALIEHLENMHINVTVTSDGSYESIGDMMLYRYAIDFDYNGEEYFVEAGCPNDDDMEWYLEELGDTEMLPQLYFNQGNDFKDIRTLDDLDKILK